MALPDEHEAPADPPSTWLDTRRAKQQQWRAASPEWRERMVPKTVLGISVIILAFAVGSAFSGVALYAYYQNRLDEDAKFNKDFAAQFGQQFDNAKKTIEADATNARAGIQSELEPLRKVAAGGETLGNLQKAIGPSTFFVQTQNEAGAASVGSAFVVTSDSRQSYLLASYTTVKASTRAPGPGIVVRQGGTQIKATLWTWDESKDLALLIIDKGSLPKLAFAPASPPLKLGERVFAASGLGGTGTSLTQGFVSDISAAGIMHDAAIGQGFQGGPLINSDGKVLGIASRSYAPLGYASDAVWFAVPSRNACDKVLKCPNGDPGGASAGQKA
ncbi:MAG: S1C family serine protease [Acidimicrobiales bacterium]